MSDTTAPATTPVSTRRQRRSERRASIEVVTGLFSVSPGAVVYAAYSFGPGMDEDEVRAIKRFFAAQVNGRQDG